MATWKFAGFFHSVNWIFWGVQVWLRVNHDCGMYLIRLWLSVGWLLLCIAVLPGDPGGTADTVSGLLNIWEGKKTNVWDGMFPNEMFQVFSSCLKNVSCSEDWCNLNLKKSRHQSKQTILNPCVLISNYSSFPLSSLFGLLLITKRINTRQFMWAT